MGILTFKGGVHPYDGKELSKNSPVVKYLPKGDMVYPLSQLSLIHIFLYRKEFPITLESADEYVTIIVFTHSLQLTEEFHSFRNA